MWWLHILIYICITIFGDKGASCKFWVICFPKLNQNNSFKLPFEHHDNLQQLRHQFVSFHICHIRPWTSATVEKCSACQESTRMKLLGDSIFDGNHSCGLPGRKETCKVHLYIKYSNPRESTLLFTSDIYLLPVSTAFNHSLILI